MKALELNRSLLDQSGLLAEAVNLAYEPQRPAPKANWTFSKSITCGDAECRLLVSDSGVGCLAIAGTNGIGDWSQNLQVGLTNYRGIYSLHDGFWKSADMIYKAVLAEGDRLPDCFANGEYLITGHSLGGATAPLLALMIDMLRDDRLETPSGVVSFGSPLYVVDDGALLWPCHVLHIQSTLDIVSHIPLGFFVRQWARAGQQVYINDRGFSCYPGHEVKRLISYAYRATVFLLNLAAKWGTFGMVGSVKLNLKGIKEHSMLLYETRVKQGLKQLAVKREMLSDA